MPQFSDPYQLLTIHHVTTLTGLGQSNIGRAIGKVTILWHSCAIVLLGAGILMRNLRATGA